MDFADPKKNIERLDLTSGMHVADFGVGSGHYALAAAKAVGDSGKVYAIDIQKDLLSKVKAGAEGERLHNVEIVWGDLEAPEGTKLANESMDAGIMSNLLFQAEDKNALLREACRVLRPRAKLLVIDWSDSFGGLGPQSGHVVSKESAQTLLAQNGFTVTSEFDAGAHHYGLIVRKD